MKKLLLLIICLSAKALVGAEPPASPREGREAGKHAFIARITHKRAASVPNNTGIPRTEELSPETFRNRVDTALEKLNQRRSQS